MSEVDPREHQEVKDRGCEITSDILGGYAGRLKTSCASCRPVDMTRGLGRNLRWQGRQRIRTNFLTIRRWPTKQRIQSDFSLFFISFSINKLKRASTNIK